MTQTNSGEDKDPAPPRHQRVFLHEPGWKVGLKVGSEREYCYAMAPGQDYYHRILDGEIYVHRPEERLCFACACRRGILTHAPKALREPISGVAREVDRILDQGAVARIEIVADESNL